MSVPDSPLADGRTDFAVIFLHSALDDFGLDASTFRVYAHLSRRAGGGEAWPAVASIAEVCRLHPTTVRTALRSLVTGRLITRQDRPGTSAIYRLTPKADWLPAAALAAHPSQTDTLPKPIQGTPTKPIQGHPSQTDTGEGSPSLRSSTEINPKYMSAEPSAVTSSPEPKPDPAATIYAAYPRKADRKQAIKAIAAALKSYPLAYLLERTELYARLYTDDPQYIPHPHRWFKNERFLEDPSTWRGCSAATGPARRAPSLTHTIKTTFNTCVHAS